MADELLISVIVPFAASLFGVAIGGFVTYLASLKILEHQQNIQRVNIAKAFLSEIKVLEKWLKPSVEDTFLTDSKKIIDFNFYRHAIDDLHWDRTFYEDTDLYFNSRPLMYRFDEELYEELEKFYSNLLVADEYRQVFMSGVNLGTAEVNPLERRRYSETIDALKHTCSSISGIKTQLERIISIYGKKREIRKFKKN